MLIAVACACADAMLLVLLLQQVARQEQIDAVRAELVAKSGGDAEAAFGAERARVGDEKRAELEAQLAAAAAEAEAAAAAAEVGGRLGLVLGRCTNISTCNSPAVVTLLMHNDCNFPTVERGCGDTSDV
jgi:hypothetical protein